MQGITQTEKSYLEVTVGAIIEGFSSIIVGACIKILSFAAQSVHKTRLRQRHDHQQTIKGSPVYVTRKGYEEETCMA
jgi:hypothetical protein